MTDHERFVALIRLRDMLYFGVWPTGRRCGFGPEVVRALVQEVLVPSGDRKPGEDPDRYTIEAILPAGESFVAEQKALRAPAY